MKLHSVSFRIVILIFVAATGSDTDAAITGSGSITGIFNDTVATVSPAYRFGYFEPLGYDDSPSVSMSQGAGSSLYRWGADWEKAPNLYLDNSEISFESLAELNLSDEDLAARATLQYEISTNLLSFTGADFVNQPQGQTFVAGTLFYNNGVSLSGSEVPSVELILKSTSATSEFVQQLNLRISIATSPNIYDENGDLLEEASADFIYFLDRPELGSFRVFENKATSVEVLAEFNSLDLVGFGAVADPSVGFVDTRVAVVPEPAVGIWGCACALVGLLKRDRKSRNKTAA